MADNTHYLSQDKFNELKEELQQLKTVERKKIAENLEYAKSLGDLSENAEYHEARDKQADVEDRIAELEETIKYGQIIKSHHADMVEVGTTVVTKREDSGAEEKFVIVGAEEADMSVGKISHESPLGSTLLGHKKGEKISVTTPRGEIKYKIIDIQ
ncbi:MAG TPA: transcription elongation factor GreA [Candidatus Paceibacterota bacterium]|nr:transcription elongation factor GreA [Candidatus Paceibacterota bacterium]